ncbi:MAG: hydroxymethylglutaryl-CoA reductase, degradative [Candidatus Undinarchaeales archaeon]
MKSSRISGFYKLSIEERLQKIKEFADLSDEDIEILKKNSFKIDKADSMIENVFSTFTLPLGTAVNFKINDKDYLIPMATEEPSVVAAASNGAKIAREKGGFKAETTDPVMIGQIQLITENPKEAEKLVLENKDKMFDIANKQDSTLVKFGGGVKDVKTKILKEDMLLIHILVDCRDAMGANAVNTMCEALAPYIENLTDGSVVLRIISNLADRRLVKVKAVFDKEKLGGEEVVDSIIKAYELAELSPYRTATHNKGIMNGIDAVVLASGNDTRAIEAGAHSFAAKDGKYSPLTKYEKNKDGDLVGTLEMPMALGTVGGATRVHPTAKVVMKILGVKSSSELAKVAGAVGLAQNFAALKALSAEGIQRGHMRLHARNISETAGAKGELAGKIAEKMISEENISVSRAKELLKELK